MQTKLTKIQLYEIILRPGGVAGARAQADEFIFESHQSRCRCDAPIWWWHIGSVTVSFSNIDKDISASPWPCVSVCVGAIRQRQTTADKLLFYQRAKENHSI